MGMIRQLLNRFSVGSRRRSASRQKRLDTEVSACLSVLELLEAQILSAVDKGNQSTDQLSCAFGDMASRARDVVHHASTTGDALHAIEQDLKCVMQCMHEIEDIVRQARLVSLNGRIEASAAGKHGEGFAVVAAETGELALRVTEASTEIRKVVDKLADTLRHTSEGDLNSARQSSDELASSISRSVMSLQFQDAVSQRMHHVTDLMAEIRTHIKSFVDSKDSPEVAERREQWMQKLSATYCVAEEHEIHAGGGPVTADLSADVELF